MAGWYLSVQARQALRTTRSLARGRRAVGSADPLLVAIPGQWDDEQAAGPALLRACGMTADQASQLAATLLPTEPAEAAVPEAEPRITGTLRFVLDQAYRIAAEARSPYVGTEHLVVAILWQDTFIGAHELRRLGVSHARAAEQLATLPHHERAEQTDPLEEVEVPTPAVARLGELARQQAEQHPIGATGASAPCTTCWPCWCLSRRLAGCCGSWASGTTRWSGTSRRRAPGGWPARTGAPRSIRLRVGRSSGSPTSSTR